MKTTTKRFLSVLMAVIMMVSLLPISAFADESQIGGASLTLPLDESQEGEEGAIGDEHSSADGDSFDYGSLPIGKTASISGNVGSNHRWSSNKTSVATVSGTAATGTVSGVSIGSATITHSYYNSSGKNRTQNFSVKVVPVVSANDVTLYPGDSAEVTIAYTDGCEISAYSTDSGIATVSLSGNTLTVTGVKPGETNYTVTASKSVDRQNYSSSVSCKIVVNSTSVSVSPASLSVNVGGTANLTATTVPEGGAVTWSSSNTAVATVSGGVVTGVAKGSATITATDAYNNTASASVTVVAPPPALGTTVLSMGVGSTSQIVNATPNCTYLVLNGGDVISVDEDGIVTANAAGSATVSVTTEQGGVGYVVVYVGENTINTKKSTELFVGDTDTVTPYIVGGDNVVISVAQAEEIISVSEDNGTYTITGEKAGTATITFTLKNGETAVASCNMAVTVLEKGADEYYTVTFCDEFNNELFSKKCKADNSIACPTEDELNAIGYDITAKGEEYTFTGFTGGTLEDDPAEVVIPAGGSWTVTDNARVNATYSVLQKTLKAYAVFYKSSSDYSTSTNPIDTQSVDINKYPKTPACKDEYKPGDAGNIDGYYYQFEGWYSDAACTTPFSFNNPITKEMDDEIAVYAKYEIEKCYVYFLGFNGVMSDSSGSYTLEFYKGATANFKTPAKGKSGDSGNKTIWSAKQYQYDIEFGKTIKDGHPYTLNEFQHWLRSDDTGKTISAGSSVTISNIDKDYYYNAVYEPTSTYRSANTTSEGPIYQDRNARVSVLLIDQYGRTLGNTVVKVPVYKDPGCQTGVYEAWQAESRPGDTSWGLSRGYVSLKKDVGSLEIDGKTYVLTDDGVTENVQVGWYCMMPDHQYGRYETGVRSYCGGGTWTGTGVVTITVKEVAPENAAVLNVAYYKVPGEDPGLENASLLWAETGIRKEVGEQLWSKDYIREITNFGFRTLVWESGSEGLPAADGGTYTLKLYYNAPPFLLRVNYLDSRTGLAIPASEFGLVGFTNPYNDALDVGVVYDITSPAAPAGYTGPDRAKVTGRMVNNNVDEFVYYTPKDYPYVVNYVDTNGSVISDPVSGKAAYKSTVDAGAGELAKAIDGYRFIEYKDNTGAKTENSVITIAIEESTTPVKNVITRVYELISTYYSVVYEWDGDAPESAELPNGGEAKVYEVGKDKATLADGYKPITDENGTWTFNSWTGVEVDDNNQFEGTSGQQIVVKGSWEFTTDKFTVKYEWDGEAPASAVLPEDGATKTYDVGQKVTLAAGYEPITDAYGEWTFNGWTGVTVDDNNQFTGAKDDEIVIKGSWDKDAYTFTVKYEWDGEAPASAVLPEDGATKTYDVGQKVTLAAGYEPITDAYGEWTFNGWTGVTVDDNNQFTGAKDDEIVIKGSWDVTPIDYSVGYEYTGTVPSGAPAVPAAATKHYGDSVTVAPAPTLLGYTFSGWTTTDATISGGSFTMPAKDVKLVGSWTKQTFGTITLTAGSDEKTYDGTPLTKLTYSLTGALREGDKIESVTVSGSVTNVEATSTANVITAYVIKDKENVDVTDFYDVSTVAGTLKINPRKVLLQSGSATKVFDGTPLTSDVVTVGGSGFAAGEGATYNVTGTITQPGNTANTFTYTLNKGTLADNYVITVATGTLTVTPQQQVLYRLTIHYVDLLGNTLAPDYIADYTAGTTYARVSPAITGFTPDQQIVNGTMPAGNVEITVTYMPATKGGPGPGPGPDPYDITEITDDDIPLAFMDGMHKDSLWTFLFTTIAMISQGVYAKKKKKYQEEAYELNEKLYGVGGEEE